MVEGEVWEELFGGKFNSYWWKVFNSLGWSGSFSGFLALGFFY
jgi:hypothetical protein